MVNQTFMNLSEDERTAKFKAVLNTRTRGRLTGDEVREILEMLGPERQYEVMVHPDPDSFCREIGRTGAAGKRLVLGAGCVAAARKGPDDAGQEPVAVSVRKVSDGGESNELHIFIPPERHAGCAGKMKQDRGTRPDDAGEGRTDRLTA